MERKAVFVSTETHKKLKILSAELNMPIGKMVDKWVTDATPQEEIPQFKGTRESLELLNLKPNS